MKTNRQLQQDVLDEFRWHPNLRELEIGVAAKDGVVTLTGEAESYTQKIEAEKAAKSVFGVRGVAEELQVKVPSAWKRTDTEIAHAAVTALKWNASVPADSVTVKVENGWVTLTSTVRSWAERADAAEAAWSAPGVHMVEDLLTVGA